MKLKQKIGNFSDGPSPKHTLKVNNNRTRDLTRFGELESKEYQHDQGENTLEFRSHHSSEHSNIWSYQQPEY